MRDDDQPPEDAPASATAIEIVTAWPPPKDPPPIVPPPLVPPLAIMITPAERDHLDGLVTRYYERQVAALHIRR